MKQKSERPHKISVGDKLLFKSNSPDSDNDGWAHGKIVEITAIPAASTVYHWKNNEKPQHEGQAWETELYEVPAEEAVFKVGKAYKYKGRPIEEGRYDDEMCEIVELCLDRCHEIKFRDTTIFGGQTWFAWEDELLLPTFSTDKAEGTDQNIGGALMVDASIGEYWAEGWLKELTPDHPGWKKLASRIPDEFFKREQSRRREIQQQKQRILNAEKTLAAEKSKLHELELDTVEHKTL